MVRDNTTPRPYQPRVTWQDQSQDESLTPNWLNDVRDVRHAPAPLPTPLPVYGKAAKSTMPMARRMPMKPEIRIPTLEPCWDCHGRGTMKDSYVVACRVCPREWTRQQCTEHGSETRFGFTLPCGHTIKGRTFKQITWVEAECPTCCNQDRRAHPFQTDPGWLPNWRTVDELNNYYYEQNYERIFNQICEDLDIPEETTAEMRARMVQGFSTSAPTAPAAPFPMPMPPLPPDDGTEF